MNSILTITVNKKRFKQACLAHLFGRKQGLLFSLRRESLVQAISIAHEPILWLIPSVYGCYCIDFKVIGKDSK